MTLNATFPVNWTNLTGLSALWVSDGCIFTTVKRLQCCWMSDNWSQPGNFTFVKKKKTGNFSKGRPKMKNFKLTLASQLYQIRAVQTMSQNKYLECCKSWLVPCSNLKLAWSLGMAREYPSGLQVQTKVWLVEESTTTTGNLLVQLFCF